MHIHVWKGSELKRRLRTASIDLAVMEEFDHEPDLCQELIAEDRLVAVTAVDDPLLSEGSITARQLSEAPLLLREKGAGVRDQFESEMQRLGFHISPLWESASSLVLLEAAVTGRESPFSLISLPSLHCIGARWPSFLSPALTLPGRMALTWHKDKFITGPMQTFMDIVRSISISPEL